MVRILQTCRFRQVRFHVSLTYFRMEAAPCRSLALLIHAGGIPWIAVGVVFVVFVFASRTLV